MSSIQHALQQECDEIASDVHLEGLTAEEEPLLPPNAGKQARAQYVAARNILIYIWRRDVKQYLTLEEACAHKLVPRSLRAYAHIAWKFLDTFGFINFGVSEAILKRTRALAQGEAKQHGSVVIIGAGLAGLAAAHQLQKLGYQTFILEAKSHPGGRVHTLRLEGQGHEAVADLGGSIITGVKGNPLAVLARQLDIPLHKIEADPDDCPLYQSDGSVVSQSLDNKAVKVWNEIENQASRVPENYTLECADAISLGTFIKVKLQDHCGSKPALENMLNWHYANMEFSAAALGTQLSVTRWAEDDSSAYEGDHAWVPGCNVRLIKALADEVPVLYNTVAKQVHYGTSGATVVTGVGTAVSADACIVTVPLGVLKAGHISFTPELPQAKQTAITRLGFGVLNKVVLLFSEQWWENRDTFGHVADKNEEPGWCYLWYCFPGISGGHLIAALVAGQAALDIEALPNKEVVARVMSRLRQYHKDRSVPDPVESFVTHWGRDPHTLGSYSSVPPGCNGQADYKCMAANVDGRLFFAGEATSYQYPAQMHGAYNSGLREAAKVHAALTQQATGIEPGSAPGAMDQKELLEHAERAARIITSVKAEFDKGADITGCRWSAIHAQWAEAEVKEWAVLKVDLAKMHGVRSHVPPLFRVVPMQMLQDVAEAGVDGVEEFIYKVGRNGVLKNLASVQECDRMESILKARNGGAVPDGNNAFSNVLQKWLHGVEAQSSTPA